MLTLLACMEFKPRGQDSLAAHYFRLNSSRLLVAVFLIKDSTPSSYCVLATGPSPNTLGSTCVFGPEEIEEGGQRYCLWECEVAVSTFIGV